MKKIMIIAGVIIWAATASAEWDWFAALDKNADGKVAKEEWIIWQRIETQRKKGLFSEEKAMQIFVGKDLNGDGIITREELTEAQKLLKQKNASTVG